MSDPSSKMRAIDREITEIAKDNVRWLKRWVKLTVWLRAMSESDDPMGQAYRNVRSKMTRLMEEEDQ